MNSPDNVIPISRGQKNPRLLQFAVTAGATRVDGAIGIRPTQPRRDKPAVVVELAKRTEADDAKQISSPEESER
jgi:hypothetical protein